MLLAKKLRSLFSVTVVFSQSDIVRNFPKLKVATKKDIGIFFSWQSDLPKDTTNSISEALTLTANYIEDGLLDIKIIVEKATSNLPRKPRHPINNIWKNFTFGHSNFGHHFNKLVFNGKEEDCKSKCSYRIRLRSKSIRPEKWDDKAYFFPVIRSEMNKNDLLVELPGY